MEDLAKGPIFVVGMGRSGTTLLRLMLNRHPHIGIPYESHFVAEYAPSVLESENDGSVPADDEIIAKVLSEPMLKTWDLTPSGDDIRSALGAHSGPKAIIDALYSLYAKAHGKVRWGDKSDYLNRMYLVNELFPDAQFIHILRDGRDVASSVMKLPWGPNTLIEAAQWWERYVEMGRGMGKMLPAERYTEVRYEDLVTEPHRELSRLCSFMDEPFDECLLVPSASESALIPASRKSQHHGAGQPVTAGRVSAWKKELSDSENAVFEHYAGERLRELGYETVSTPGLSVAERLQQVRILLTGITR